MRSPWKYIGTLISQRLDAESKTGHKAGDATIHADRREEPWESKVSVPKAPMSRSEDDTAAITAGPYLEEQADQVDLPMPTVGVTDASRIEFSAGKAKKAVEKERKKAIEHAPALKKRLSVRFTQAATGGNTSQASKPIAADAATARIYDELYADVESVDAEIIRLKYQLKNALAYQNKQLRAMLVRLES
jgi:hypothetical protein